MANMQTVREPRPGEEGGAHSVGSPSAKQSHIPTPEAVREQLERLLASPHFASSPRCQKLLRYVVEQTIRGRAESLKERNLGIEVFEREATYDTNANPVVRVAASEVRKKLAQYYFDSDSQGQIRIEIPAGSYVPEFSMPTPGPAEEKRPPGQEAVHPDVAEVQAKATPVAVPLATVRPRRKAVKLAMLASGLLAICVGLLGWRAITAENPMQKFWAPALKSPNQVLLCSGQLRASRMQLDPMPSRNPGATATPFGQEGSDAPNLPQVAVLNDSITLANIAGMLRSERKQFWVRSERNANYEALQRGPVVLIGALNNDWTMRLMRNMRFQFNQDLQAKLWWISDQKNPGVKLGAKNPDGRVPLTQDLAIVARVLDPETRQPTIIVAGLTSEGTLAAGNFVTNPQYLSDFLKSGPPYSLNGNLEILLSVNVIDNQPGPPRVIASSVW
jgi:hypothetical protein